MVSTLSSWAASMKEQVLTIRTSALSALLVISMPCEINEPSMTSASTRFLAQPREISPTRIGGCLELPFFNSARLDAVRSEGNHPSFSEQIRLDSRSLGECPGYFCKYFTTA